MPSDEFLKQSLNGGGDPILTLMCVKFEGNTYYFANNNENVTSSVDGTTQTYIRSGFSLSLPDDTDEGIPTATLSFEAADVQIIRELRDTEEPLTIDIWLVLGSDPNTIEYGPVNYQSSSFNISGSGVTIELEVEPILQVQVPGNKFTPNTFPGLFDGL